MLKGTYTRVLTTQRGTTESLVMDSLGLHSAAAADVAADAP